MADAKLSRIPGTAKHIRLITREEANKLLRELSTRQARMVLSVLEEVSK
jgi:hypothetical protein